MNVGSSQTAQAKAPNKLSTWHSTAVNRSLYMAHRCILCENDWALQFVITEYNST